MQVLVVGGGGREHALAWKVAQNPAVQTVFVAPGNAGTAREPKLRNLSIAADDVHALLAFARTENIALTIVGPEAPLVAGIRDAFDAAGLACFGPSRAAAQLEGSKAFSKAFLARHGIPTAAYATFTDLADAKAYVQAQGVPIVIKADGLAAGKGVVIAQHLDEAMATLEDMLSGNAFGAAGSRVVIEEFLQGEEASFICLCDGSRALPFASSQDHKAVGEGDTGPNTGGMGAYSPAPVVTPAVHERIMREVINPTVAGMRAEGMPYQGFLYAGLMITADGTPYVIEFNCRFGDPEAEPIMQRLQTDLVSACQQALAGDISALELTFDPRVALAVVMAAGGYPGDYTKGDAISGLAQLDGPDLKVFHAGTGLVNDQVVTNGGRVLCVSALGDSLRQAQRRAYAAVQAITWRDCYFRKDIGYRALAREQAPANN